MDDSLYAVLLSIAMFILFVVVPLIPSVLIYKIFPDTKVVLSGPLANLTLNASGAFAAYVVVVILCYSPFQRSEELIAGLAYPTWTVTGSVVLVDKDDNVIPNQQKRLGDGLKVITTPDLAKASGDEVVLTIPGIADPMRTIAVSLPGYGQTNINLQKLNKEKIIVDNFHKHLDVGEIRIPPNGLVLPTSYSGSNTTNLPITAGPPATHP